MSKEINDLKQQIIWLQNQNASLINRQEALRDHFAGLAMQGLIGKNESMDTNYEEDAAHYYFIADAMLAEREKSND